MSVLVISAEPIGARMAGPSIRALELARSLARAGIEATLAAPSPSELPEGSGLGLVEAGLADHAVILEAARSHDVVVAQQLPLGLLKQLTGLPTRLVADLYNPTPVEVVEAAADEPPAEERRSRAIVASQAVAMLAASDAIVCASERQRDFWHGAMAAWGMAAAAPVEVVPFGLPDEPPPSDGAALRERFPEIAAGEPVLLWGGGIWNWLDAATPIRAVERLAEDGLRAHLVFLGVDRPRAGPLGAMSRSRNALAEAERRGLLGSLVHVNHGWVPYAERGAHLAGATLGVSAHHAHLEARFAHRTRVLDYIWAGLPVVLTGGDPLSELAASQGLGRVVSHGDDRAFAAACRELLTDDAERAACAERIAAVREGLRWSVVTRPLVELCSDPSRLPRRAVETGVLRAVSAYQYPLVARDIASREGAGALARRLARRLRRMGPGR